MINLMIMESESMSIIVEESKITTNGETLTDKERVITITILSEVIKIIERKRNTRKNTKDREDTQTLKKATETTKMTLISLPKPTNMEIVKKNSKKLISLLKKIKLSILKKTNQKMKKSQIVPKEHKSNRGKADKDK